MEYIGNGFSPNMVGNNTIQFKEINKKEFMKAAKTARSIIGHPEIAEVFGLPCNRESITLNRGDVLYIVTPSQRLNANQMVENGAHYEFVPESEGYTYRKVMVIQ